MRTKTWLTAVAASMLALSACPVDPGPSAPTWVTTRIAADGSTGRSGAWTSDTWLVNTVLHGNDPSEIEFRKRSGAGGSVLGAPQVLASGQDVAGVVIGEGNLIGVRGSSGGVGSVEFFRESGGTWTSAGVVFPDDLPLALTGDWLVTREAGDGSSDRAVKVYAVDDSGPTVSLTLDQSLLPNASWPADVRAIFGSNVAASGNLIVAGAAPGFGSPGAARAFRYDGTDWQPVLDAGNEVGGSVTYGSTVAVDDGPSVDRVVVGANGSTLTGPATDLDLDVYADSGSGFALEQSLVPDPTLPADTSTPTPVFGKAVAIDGDRLALVSRWSDAATTDPGTPVGKVGHVQVWKKGATWAPEVEKPVSVSPLPAGTTGSIPTALQMSGHHVAVTTIVSFPPPPGCPFPGLCLSFTLETWSIDRTA